MPPVQPTADAHIGRIAAVLLAQSEQMTSAMATAIADRVPGLAAEPALGDEILASTRANVVRFLTAIAARPSEPVPTDVPLEALDLARTFVRRGLDLQLLAHVYRWGQNVAWRQWMEVATTSVPATELGPVLDRSSTLLFTFVDEVLAGMDRQVEQERGELMTGTAARREQTVRLLLEGAPMAEASASRVLGYALDRFHTAFVVWSDPGADTGHGDLERIAAVLGRAAGAPRVLTIPVGRASLWGWIATGGPVSIDDLAAAVPSGTDGPRVAVGDTHEGLRGFRRSHEEAESTQRLLVGGHHDRRFIAHRDVSVVALMPDGARLQEFVLETLGPLADGGRATADLAETVRIYLQEGDNAARTADRLNTHRNTVLQRVARAERLLGRPLRDVRVPLTVALEADAQLGLSRRPTGQ